MCTHVDRLKAWLDTALLARSLTVFDHRGAIQTAGAHRQGFIAPTSTQIQVAHTVPRVQAPTCFVQACVLTCICMSIYMSIQPHMHVC